MKESLLTNALITTLVLLLLVGPSCDNQQDMDQGSENYDFSQVYRTYAVDPPGPGKHVYLDLGTESIWWSISNEETGLGFLYFVRPPNPDWTDDPVWEFAFVGRSDISQVTNDELKTQFISGGGQYTDGHTITTVKVNVGQVVLARLAYDPSRIYIMKLLHYDVGTGTLDVEYIVAQQ